MEKKVGEKGGETEQSNQEKAGWGGGREQGKLLLSLQKDLHRSEL